MNFETSYWADSDACAGVRYRVRRLSFGSRVFLMRELHSLAARREHARSLPDQAQVEEAMLTADIQETYLRVGLSEVSGLEIDGKSPTADEFVRDGPEELVSEALHHVVREFGLTEQEEKNSSSHSTSA